MSGHQPNDNPIKLDTIESAIDDIKNGKLIIVVDDEDRENEGDFLTAARNVTPEIINFMATHGRGLICAPLIESRCEELGLDLMVTVSDNTATHATPFTVSVDLLGKGCTTGISASDRSKTVQALIDPATKPEELGKPGHIFPLKARKEGVLRRAGHTEAAIDFARLAGFEPAGCIVEIMNEDGSMARRPDLEKFAQSHNLKIGTIADLIHYRTLNERTVICTNSREVDTLHGSFTLKTYKDTARNECHFALVKGAINPEADTLVRVHVGSTLRDVLGIQQPGAPGPAWTCQSALARVAKEGAGVVVLICHNETTDDVEESIDWLLTGKVRRPNVELAYKQVGTGSQILKDLGVCKMRLMSAPYKFNGISGFNLEVTGYVEHPGE